MITAQQFFIYENPDDPLEDQIGHTTIDAAGVVTFHPWDTCLEDYFARKDIAPGVLPSPHELSLERFRVLGRKMARERDERLLAALEGRQ